MKVIVQKIIDVLGTSLSKILLKTADAVKQAFQYLEKKLEHTQKKEMKKQEDMKMKTIDEVCDNGSLDDLLDLASKTFAIMITFMSMALASGCMSASVIEISPTQPWEGHYFTAEELNDSIRSIQLDDGESVWVLSNKTLRRVLKERQR